MLNKKLSILALSSLMMIASPVLLAEKNIGLSYTGSAKGKEIYGYQFDDVGLLKLNFFQINRDSNQWGYYGSLGISTETDGVYYSYLLANVGATYSLNSNAYAFLGGGYSMEAAEFVYDNSIYQSEEDNNGFNANIGLGYNLGKLGFTVDYDSAPQAVSLGATYVF